MIQTDDAQFTLLLNRGMATLQSFVTQLEDPNKPFYDASEYDPKPDARAVEFDRSNTKAINLKRKFFWKLNDAKKSLKQFTDSEGYQSMVARINKKAEELEAVKRLARMPAPTVTATRVTPTTPKPRPTTATTSMTTTVITNEFTQLEEKDGEIGTCSGYNAVQKFLEEQRGVKHNCRCYILNGERQVVHENAVPSNPAFSYDHDPLPNWRRDVTMCTGGRNYGVLLVTYTTPDRRKRLRGKSDLITYLAQNGISSWHSDKFSFKRVYCVCHQCEQRKEDYLECSYGLGGCGGWVHSDCVGLGKKTTIELENMPKTVCPLCVRFLQGTEELTRFRKKNVLLLDKITLSDALACKPSKDNTSTSNNSSNRNVSVINAHNQQDAPANLFEASPVLHDFWGVEGTQYVYYPPSATHTNTNASNIINNGSSTAIPAYAPFMFDTSVTFRYPNNIASSDPNN